MPACVNPDHLFLGTHQDNMRDMYAKGRRAGPGYALLGDVEAIKDILESKNTLRELAAKYGAHYTTIHRIKARGLA
jgi:hypothetical protein